MKRKSITISFTLALVASFFYSAPANATDIIGSGSSFAANFIDRCRVEYANASLGSVSYSPTGSGAGKTMFTKGLSNFAMSDVPYSSSEQKPEGEFIYVPLVSGPIAIVYKLDKYPITIKMSTDTLSKVFAGQITKWNDPQILKENFVGGKSPKIPSKLIKVIYRADGSGTSEVFTSYLNAVSPKIWSKAGNKAFSASFPGDISKNIMLQSANGSQGVAMLQGITDGSIGYNEVSYARGLKTVSVQNAAGVYKQPTVSAAAAFLGDFVSSTDGTVKVNYNNPNKLAYNISTFTYGIAFKQKNENNDSVKKFFTFMADKCGKKAEDLGYAPLRGNMLKFAKARIAEVSSK
jgi:phosphate transport system substrate-binding protein